MWILRISLLPIFGWAAFAGVRLLPEHLRPDPFGEIAVADRPSASRAPLQTLAAARGGYVSLHAVTEAVDIQVQSKLTAEVYREWFHRNRADGNYYPDALVPMTSRIDDNRIDGQKVRAYWIDIWIPADQRPGRYPVRVVGGKSSATVTIQVLPAVIPADDVLMMDHNSYGTSWLFGQYPNTLPKDDDGRLFALIHAYHRVFYEHRGGFHQLGYGHGGKVGPEFAPELAGVGRGKHVANWDRFDRHYGPLLDGSAFKATRRGPRPIPFVYLPINPEWPASYLWWGEPGYEAEFRNVVGEMEKHFRGNGWTSTVFELFFNHKKRYKAFSWDGDEVRFAADNDAVITMRRLFDKSLPPGTPVQFALRSDASWSLEDQMERMRGVINFWVAGEGMMSWYPGAIAKLKERGDRVWTYGGTPVVSRPAAEIALNPLRTWITGSQGFVRWQTVDPGSDPWYSLDGGGETLVYPGDRFGVAAPLASVRLKLQRNVMQDLALLQAKATLGNARNAVQTEVVRRFNDTSLADWHNTRPALASTPVLEWTNQAIDDALEPFNKRFRNIDAASWFRVREYAQ